MFGITNADPAIRWKDEEISRWKALEPQLLKLFSISVIWTVVKAANLSYEYTNLLQNIKIINDIRPIYNENASKIEGSIISYGLRIYFDSIEGNKSLSIAVDENDIIELQKKCDRALKKAKTAKDFMMSHDIDRTMICGEDK